MPHDTGAVRSQCGANGKLARARRGAGEQEVRDVGAGDQQDNPHSSQQHQERSAHVFDEFVLEGLDVGSQASVRGRVELNQVLLDRAHLRVRLGDGDAGFQAANTEDRMDCTIAEDHRIALSERCVNIRVVSDEAKVRGKHSDNGVVNSVQGYRLAERLRTASETTSP